MAKVEFLWDWAEYSAIAVSLVVSVVISFRFYKQANDFRERAKLPFIPIVMSLIASSTSGVTMLGKPAESYAHGIEFLLFIVFSMILNYATVSLVFLPVILKLNTVSIYEYFDLRFDARVRRLVSMPFIMMRTLSISLVVIPPTLVIHQFSGMKEELLTILLILFTTFYTMIGGFKGVIWTDTLQGVVMIISMIVLTTLSVSKVGSFGEVIEIAYDTNRLDIPPISFDPTVRFSVWAYGLFFCGLSTVVFNQSVYQRFKSLSNENEIRRAMAGMFLGVGAFACASTFVGLSIYAYYYGCDPKDARYVDSYSNVIVYWINEVGRKIRGIRGLYIAGITCASISTMSTHLNTVAELICSEMKKGNPSRGLMCLATLGTGLASTAIALVITNTSSLIELSFYFNCLEGIASGLFILGTLFVSANAKGALSGGLSVIVLFVITSVGSQLSNKVSSPFPSKIMRTDLCPGDHNATEVPNIASTIKSEEETFYLFKLSPFCMPTICALVTVGLGVAVSAIGPESRRMTEEDKDLFSPCVHQFLARKDENEEHKEETDKLFEIYRLDVQQ